MNAPATKVEADEFESAFNEFTSEKETPDTEMDTSAGEAESKETPTSEPADAEPAGEAAHDGDAETAGSEEDGAETTSKPAAESEPAGDEDDVDWEAAFRALKSKVEKGEVVASPKAEEKPQPVVQEQDIYSTDEKEVLKTYETDWPEVSKGEALRRRAEYRDLTKFIFEEVAKSLKPLYDYYGESSDDLQYRSITKVHPDYDALYAPLQEWITKQPRYLRATYEHVAKEGTTEDVVDLITRFKKETEWKTPDPEQQGGEKPPVKSSKGLPTTAKQAAKSLGAVSTKRTTVANAQDPNDFEGAFEEFVKADAKR